jgi:hypothetical protein
MSDGLGPMGEAIARSLAEQFDANDRAGTHMDVMSDPRAGWGAELQFKGVPEQLRGPAYIKAAQVMAETMEEARQRIHRLMPQVKFEWHGTGIYDGPPF